MRLSTLAAALLACVALAGCSDDPPACDNSQCGPCEGTVERALDGDTIELADGTKVRYLLVDTPESTEIGRASCRERV